MLLLSETVIFVLFLLYSILAKQMNLSIDSIILALIRYFTV